jgi:hypothetical protein
MRAWRTGARFDAVQWARDASFFCLGSMTFKEAFERTGRILNISGERRADYGQSSAVGPRR